MVGLLLLSAGLSRVTFLPGQPIDLARFQTATGASATLPPAASAVVGAVWNIVLVLLVWIVLPLGILHLILSSDARKRVFRDLTMLLGFVMFWLLLPHILANNIDNLQIPLPTTLETGPLGRPARGPDILANAPNWLVGLVTAAVTLVVATLLVGGGWWLWQRRHTCELDEVAVQAERALADLHAGGDFKNTIIRCYAEMSRVVSQQRGAERPADMTPREFQCRLTEIGLPSQPVEQLTRLFEAARYGAAPVTVGDEKAADACLTAIVDSATSAA